MWATTKSDHATKAARYGCIKRPGAPGCGATTIVAEPFETLITEAVLHRLDSDAMAAASKPKRTRGRVDLDLTRIERQLEDLASDYGAGVITKREWERAREQLEKRRTRAKTTSKPTARQPHSRPSNAAMSARPGTRSTSTTNAPFTALIDDITIGPAAKPGKFDIDRIDVAWKA